MNEEQYQQVCEVCDRLLADSDSTLERIAIPWLHVLNEHPSNLSMYEHLFYSGNRSFRWHINLMKDLLFSARALMSSAFLIRQPALPQKIDVLIISHLLNPSQLGAHDFYFGRLPEALAAEGLHTLVALRNQMEAHRYRYFAKDLWPPEMAPRYVLPQILGIFKEFKLKLRLLKEATRLKRAALNAPTTFDMRVHKTAAKQAVGQSAIATLRLYYQIQEMVKNLQPTSIVVTYEGHSWERIVFAAARSANPRIRCIGYHHAILFPRQHAIGMALGYPYDPDLICTAGHVTRKILESNPGICKIPLITIGTHRRESLEIAPPKNSNFSTTCLVIPDGTLRECLLLFDFVLSAATMLPNITFILRLHPVVSLATVINKDKRLRLLPENVKISYETLDKDFTKCRWALYRGSGAAIYAASAGLRPLYFKPPKEILSIDPLYGLKTWRRTVENINDLKSAFNSDLHCSFEKMKQEWLHAIEHTNQYYTHQNVKIFSGLVVEGQELNR